MNLEQKIKDFAHGLGVELVGVAGPDRLDPGGSARVRVRCQTLPRAVRQMSATRPVTGVRRSDRRASAPSPVQIIVTLRSHAPEAARRQQDPGYGPPHDLLAR